MTGKYVLKIKDDYVSYELELSRQVTVLKGNSGTGKSYFAQLCQYAMQHRGGVVCNLTEMLVVMGGAHSDLTLNDFYGKLKGKIFVCDEWNNRVLRTKEFAKFVNGSDNYFIIISRSGCLGMLTYSINDIYNINDCGAFHRLKNHYTDIERQLVPDLVITEDSCAGKEFYEKTLKCPVISANGKGNVWNIAKRENADGKLICCIVDGSAFGAELAKILHGFPREYGVYIVAPESFEWLVLNTSLYKNSVSQELERPYDFCETTKYVSWERLFTSLLQGLSSYSKANLPTEVLHYRREVLTLLGDISPLAWR